MELKEFLSAITIIGKHHSTRLIINQPKNGHVGALGTSEWTIQITDCCASVFNKLLAEGFSLSMQNGTTSVNKY